MTLSKIRIEEDEENLGYLEQINVLLTGDLTAANNEARDLISDFNKDLTGDDLKEKGINISLHVI